MKVLYSFPLKLGAARICTTAWYQIEGLATAGAEMQVLTASICRSLHPSVNVRTTLARGRFRIPNRLLGRMAYAAMHDWIVSRWIERMAGQIDIIHAWPVGALRTLEIASRLGIPTVLERCNAHTRFAYDVVQKESSRLGVSLPPGHEHAYNRAILNKEEKEYRLAYRILCPSEFVMQTFLDQAFPREQLVRHIYGVDEKMFFPDHRPRDPNHGLRMLHVGVCAVRKGLHYSLEAWLQSPACKTGEFLIAGDFLPDYQRRLAPMLAHPSIKVLGHRNDVPQLLRESDVLVLSSIEEGFGLVCTEAMASGCVPLVSDACTDLCRHLDNALVHRVGDTRALTEHITVLHEDRDLLHRLRTAGLKIVPEINWNAAGVRLLDLYGEVIASKKKESLAKRN